MLEELSAKLESGEITRDQLQEAIEKMSKNDDKNDDKQPENNDKNEVKNDGKDKKPDVTEIQKREQAAADRVRTEYAKKLKDAETALQALQREKMTADEIKAADITKREAELNELAASLKLEKNTNHAMKALSKVGLDDDEYTLLSLVLDDEPEQIDMRVQALDKAIKARVKSAIEDTFKKAGRNPRKGASEESRDESEGEALAKRLQERNKQSENDPWGKFRAQ